MWFSAASTSFLTAGETSGEGKARLSCAHGTAECRLFSSIEKGYPMFLILWLMPIAFYALTWWTTGWSLSPDGAFYCSMGRGERVPRPYAQRWLLPAVLGDRPTLWRVWGALAVVLSAVLVGEYAGTSFQTKLIAELLFMGLPGLWRLNVRLPVLVDPTALCCALGGALLMRAGHPWLATTLVLMGTSVKETTFLFAAIFEGHGVFLTGAFIALVNRWSRDHRPNPAEPWLHNPVQEARKAHDFL